MRKTRRRTGRKLWRALHLALALIAGLGFAFLGVTGSLLVFYKEIDAALNPELFTRRSSPGEHAAISAIVAAVTRDIGPVLRVDLPAAGSDGVVRIQARRSSAPHDLREVLVDPGNGQILGSRVWRSNFVAVTYDLHYTLLAGRSGRDIVGFGGIGLLLSLGSGLYLWWPRAGGLRRALHVKRRAPFSRRVYDIHKCAGLPAVVLLGVSALSGVTMQFPETTRALAHALLPAAASGMHSKTAPDLSRQNRGLASAIAQARAMVPSGNIRRILLPSGEAGTYRIYVRRPGEMLRSSGLNIVSIDAETGEVAQVRRTQDYRAADWFLAWQFPLHNGEAFGLAGRIAVVILGLLPLTLYVTGLLIWHSKRRARQRSGIRGHHR
jgi:uncharacterized iron-regulated membrane protein